MLLDYGGISRLSSQACAASVSWHCLAAYMLGHDKRAEANDIIVCFYVSICLVCEPRILADPGAPFSGDNQCVVRIV